MVHWIDIPNTVRPPRYKEPFSCSPHTLSNGKFLFTTQTSLSGLAYKKVHFVNSHANDNSHSNFIQRKKEKYQINCLSQIKKST